MNNKLKSIITLIMLAILAGSTGLTQDEDGKERNRDGIQSQPDSNVDWNAKYENFLKDNPRVKEAVESGKITREKVIAGIKSRAKETQKQLYLSPFANSVEAKPPQKVTQQKLVTHNNQVDSKRFLNSLKKHKSIVIDLHNSSDWEIQKVVKKYFSAAGVKFGPNKQPPEGNGPVSFGIPKAIYLHRKLELLMVRVTERELDIVDKALNDLKTK